MDSNTADNLFMDFLGKNKIRVFYDESQEKGLLFFFGGKENNGLPGIDIFFLNIWRSLL